MNVTHTAGTDTAATLEAPLVLRRAKLVITEGTAALAVPFGLQPSQVSPLP